MPLVVWRSRTEGAGVDKDKLTSRPYQTDVLDHTIIGLLGAEGVLYDPELDLLSEKFNPEKILPRRMKDTVYD